MSKNYQQEIILKLIKKYERSILAKEGSNKNIKITLPFDEKNMEDYVSSFSNTCEDQIEEAVSALEKENYIIVTRKNNRVIRVTLNLEQLEHIYQELNRITPAQSQKQYLDLCRKYSAQGELTTPFRERIVDLIINYKSHQKYFKDQKELQELFYILEKIENQQEEISRRTFSVKYLGDSKKLERMQSKLEMIIKECTNDPENSLLNYNITKNPSSIYLKGNIVVKINDQTIDLQKLKTELILTSTQIPHLSIQNLSVDQVITVENLTSFYEYPVQNSLIIYLGGFHNEIKRSFLRKVYAQAPDLLFFHSGDLDAGGFYILNHLINKTGIPFIAKNMDIETLKKYQSDTIPLTKEDQLRLEKLKEQEKMKQYLPVIEYMLKNNIKLEQENIDYKNT